MKVKGKKIEVRLLDKNNIIPMKGHYIPEKGVIIVKRGLTGESETYLAFPEHKYFEFYGFGKRKFREVFFVDNALKETVSQDSVYTNGKTVQLHSDNPIDVKKRLVLKYLSKEEFWLSLRKRLKMPTLQIILCLIAGIGIYTILVTVLRACGINV